MQLETLSIAIHHPQDGRINQLVPHFAPNGQGSAKPV